MISTKTIYSALQKKIINGVKIPHGTSQPLLIKENEKYFIAIFVFFYSKEDIEFGKVNRPTMWVVADLESGEIIGEYDTKEKEFSDASYEVKYNVRSDARYDTSKEYYEEAFALFDSVREKLISTGKLSSFEYESYLNKILANIPHDYQRFYRDLSL